MINNKNKPVMSICEDYNEDGKLLYHKRTNGHIERYRYNSKNNVIYGYINGYEYWIDYDKYSNPINYRDSDGYEYSINK